MADVKAVPEWIVGYHVPQPACESGQSVALSHASPVNKASKPLDLAHYQLAAR